MTTRLVLTAAALVTALVSPAVARAQVTVHHQPPLDGAFRSPQRWAFEMRFGPYSPDVDSEFDGAVKPHQEFFGNDPRLMTQFELDYQIFQGFGSLAVGGSIGYFRESARAFVEPPAGQPPQQRAGDLNRLSLVPLAALLVYRFDPLARTARIPIVPYFKLGLNYTIWSIYDGNGDVARAAPGQGRGRGGTLGWQAAGGIAFLLDIIDLGAARELDSETGINHTYLFAEGTKVASFGQSGQLRVGDTTWVMGLLFEF